MSFSISSTYSLAVSSRHLLFFVTRPRVSSLLWIGTHFFFEPFSLLSNNVQGPSFSSKKPFHTPSDCKCLSTWGLLIWLLAFSLNYTESCWKDIGDFQLPWPGAKWLQEGGRCWRMWVMLQAGTERPFLGHSHEQSAHRAVVSRGPCAICFSPLPRDGLMTCTRRNSVY